jgi:hypothetical protein
MPMDTDLAIKQEIVEDYLRKNWGLEKEFSKKRNDYYLVTPSGEKYPITERVDFNCYTEFDFENSKISLKELSETDFLVRVLRSIRDSSVLECLVKTYRQFRD